MWRVPGALEGSSWAYVCLKAISAARCTRKTLQYGLDAQDEIATSRDGGALADDAVHPQQSHALL
jgi:hypothetical protein